MSRALGDGLQAHIDQATRRVMEEVGRLAHEVAHVRQQAVEVQAQCDRLTEENRHLKGVHTRF